MFKTRWCRMGYNATDAKMKKSWALVCVALLLVSATNVAAQHKFDCPDCRGEGETVKFCPNPKCHNGAIYCETCDYSGTVNKTCNSCNGSGEVPTHKKKPCPVCKGTKYVPQERQEKCTCRNGKVAVKNRPSKAQTSKYVWVDHADCHGTGFVTVKEQVPCPHCHGRAYMIEREATMVKCDACGGTGRLKETCSKCEGKGCYACPDCKGYGNVREKCSRCKGNGVIYTD